MDTSTGPTSTRAVRDVTLMKPRRGWKVAAAVVSVLGLTLPALLQQPVFYVALIYTFWIPLVLLARGREFLIARMGATVRVSKQGLLVDSALAVRREDIRDALAAPTIPYGACVRIHRGLRSPLEIWMKNEADAHAIVAALELDPTRKVMARRALSPVLGSARGRWGLAGVLLASLVGMGLMGTLSVIPLLVFMALATTIALVPRRVSVGADGLLSQWLTRKQFIPLSEVMDVGEWKGFVRITTRSGVEPIDIPVAVRRKTSPLVAFDVAILADRIREAVRARHAGEPSFDLSLLERESRSVHDWISWLRSLTSRQDAYRAALHAEDLWQVLEDSGASPNARTAAAVVLAKNLDERGKARLRIAIETSVAPKLRVAFDAVTKNDDATLESAMQEMEREHA